MSDRSVLILALTAAAIAAAITKSDGLGFLTFMLVIAWIATILLES